MEIDEKTDQQGYFSAQMDIIPEVIEAEEYESFYLAEKDQSPFLED